MYFHPSEHIYLCHFRQNLIILDTKEDKYHILYYVNTQYLSSIIKDNFILKEDKYYINADGKHEFNKEYHELILKLIKGKILLSEMHEHPSTIGLNELDKNKKGAGSLRWSMNPKSLYSKVPALEVLKAYVILLKVNLILKLFGFNHLINHIKNQHQKNKISLSPAAAENQLDDITFSLNQACFYYFYRTKCLEWAATFTLLAIDKGIDAKLNIGVQNNPFYAHAWVEINGRVIEDIAKLPKQMSVILCEPQ